MTLAYKFTSSLCNAEWWSGTGALPCPGDTEDEAGYVLQLENPAVEGREENEPALSMHPERVDDGWITGRFPEVEIKEGDTFAAVIGCLEGTGSCNVRFQLEYEDADGFISTLGQWDEVYDEKIRSIEVDLDDLSGQKVRFIFRVQANGSPDDDRAFWLNPRILRIAG